MPVGGVQRLVTLPPAPESARHARRFVADVLNAAGAAAFTDTATLLTSELVTNGIVHAHTDLRVVVEATARWVRVEVSDGNPMLPARRSYAEDAQTGRGLEMLELLADEFGMAPLDDDGKRVWFRLGGPAGEDPDVAASAGPATDVVAVALVNLPVALYAAWQAHADAMLREATLVALEGGAELPLEFLLANQALAVLAGGTTDLFDRPPGAPRHVDLEVDVPRTVVGGFPVLRDVLRRCSERSAAGELLVPPSLPEIQAVRRWVCDEVGRQGEGLRPRPWSDPVVADTPADRHSLAAVESVRTSTAAQIAADGSNRIVAVSAAAAELLGWPAEDLEGRRLVAIIPPALRHAHIAGFTRAMLGGSPTLIGRTTDVPALRRDGGEVPIRLRIDRDDGGGRPLFVATLTPRL